MIDSGIDDWNTKTFQLNLELLSPLIASFFPDPNSCICAWQEKYKYQKKKKDRKEKTKSTWWMINPEVLTVAIFESEPEMTKIQKFEF